MNSLRIKTIASLVNKDAYLLDIGTDHAYLPIYLYENNITKNIIASDVSENVLACSLNNLKKYNLDDKIKLVLSDGFKAITDCVDTCVIAGMGTSTIIDIIDNATRLPDEFIISTHNDYYQLRKYMNGIGYSINKEIVINENSIYYIIIKYKKGKEVLKEVELLFGKSNNKEYYTYLSDYYSDLYNKSHNETYEYYVSLLKELLKEC